MYQVLTQYVRFVLSTKGDKPGTHWVFIVLLQYFSGIYQVLAWHFFDTYLVLTGTYLVYEGTGVYYEVIVTYLVLI